jgi:ribosomal protein S18 acetylase RimI-like enzyme
VDSCRPTFFVAPSRGMLGFEFRAVRPTDFVYCWTVYSEAIRPLATALGQWNEKAHQRAIEQAIAEPDASILVVERSDAGWLTVNETRFEVHLTHLYIEADRRRHGLGTRFLNWMVERAQHKHKTLTLEVLSNNKDARRLYERVGFVNQGVDGPRIRMRRKGP